MMEQQNRYGFGLLRATAIALALGAIASTGCSNKKKSAPPPSEEEPAAAAAVAERKVEPTQPFVPGTMPECDQFVQAQESKAAPAKTCSPTEQLAFRKSPKCLSCLFQALCLNDQYGDSGNECEPSGAQAATDFASGSPEEAQCLAVLGCDLGVTPTSTHHSPVRGGTNNGPVRPYCGDAHMKNCWGTPGPQGECKDVIQAGVPATVAASPQSVFLHISRKSVPTGRAGAIITCGDVNSCEACFE
jgi:hypothetical protein